MRLFFFLIGAILISNACQDSPYPIEKQSKESKAIDSLVKSPTPKTRIDNNQLRYLDLILFVEEEKLELWQHDQKKYQLAETLDLNLFYSINPGIYELNELNDELSRFSVPEKIAGHLADDNDFFIQPISNKAKQKKSIRLDSTQWQFLKQITPNDSTTLYIFPNDPRPLANFNRSINDFLPSVSLYGKLAIQLKKYSQQK